MLPPRSLRRSRRRYSLTIAAVLAVTAHAALANPNGGVVQGGVATITGQGTAHVDVHQASQGAVLSWEHFNIAPGEVTNFHQPNANATAINRILQQDPSKIFGALNANGNVYLINPNGFLFGASAKINTRSFMATTSAEDLMKLGGYDASAQSAPGAKIENQGKISAGDGGFVYLIAPRIENGKDAVITTPKGEVLLAAGATVTLTDDPSGTGLGIRYTAPGSPGGEAVNLGKLVANGGFAKMRAETVRQGGIVQANAVRENKGKIELYATRDLQLEAGSRTDASGGTGAGAGGDVHAYSEGDATMHDGAVVDVSGGAGGGDAGKAELSAKGNLALSGTFRAGAKTGSKRGTVSLDPSVLTIDGSTSFVGAGDVVAEADERIAIASNAVVSLGNDAQYGDGTAARQSFTLRSGHHISFGSGSKIVDDGSGASGQKVWDVNLVAGADLASSDKLATKAGSDGSIYLSGASFDSNGNTTTLRSNDGEVSLTHGDLTVRAAGDLVVGNGGGLKNQTGKIDVAVGRDVRFRAGSQTQDGVIENGSGDISISAGRDVLLVENANTKGNAAIRTRGVLGTDAQGQTTVTDGGSIVIQAGRDVDAGVGNRWVEPGFNMSKEEYQKLLDENRDNPDLQIPPGFNAPDFDPLPVVRDGILGIGTEAGGDVTIVAGGSVRTGVSSQQRSGGTAAFLGTQYNGSHIGVFGRPVVRVLDPLFGAERNVILEGAPASKLTVVAGDAIEGDYMVRNGEANFRAGYALANGVTAQSLDTAHLDAGLVDSATALASAVAGWFGTLTRPITIDTVEASITGVGRNGVAIRAIENPSLVYLPSANTTASSGVFAVPTWRETDGATLRSTNGDVILVGNSIDMPTVDSVTPIANPLVRLLPPNVQIQTDRGDLVLLNDFTLYPSARGGLDLNVHGKVRTAGFTASSSAVLSLEILTLGATGDLSFSLPAGTKLLDPRTGVEYTLTREATLHDRVPAKQATGEVVLRVSADAARQRVVVPVGTRVATSDGRIYEVYSEAILPAPEARLSTGQVTFFIAGGGAKSAFAISPSTEFVGPGGVRFEIAANSNVNVQPGQTQITVSVRAKTPGVDVPAFGLTLATPIAGVDYATNLADTVRTTDLVAQVRAVDAGAAGNNVARDVTALPDLVAGIEGVTNKSAFVTGADRAPTGVGASASGDAILVRAGVLGPAGQPPDGTQLVVEDPSLLPAGVAASEILITVKDPAVPATVVPSLYRRLQADASGNLRPDPTPGTVATPDPGEIWQREGSGSSARIVQSDAFPDIDPRGSAASFNYAQYFSLCRSGVSCGDLGVFGSGPTHSGDTTPTSLRALGGFERVGFELAKPAFLLSGDAGADGLFGTADDGSDGSIVDLALSTQHTSATDETVVWVPIGNASFGADSPAPGVEPDLSSGVQVAGPGSLKVLVGVLPNARAVDANGNGAIDPEENTGDLNGDGVVGRDEWRGSTDVFNRIDESQRLYAPANSPAIFTPRGLIPPGGGDGRLTPEETPYVPSGRGGSIRMAAAVSPATQSTSRGINAIGNALNPTLPLGSAAVFVAADRSVDLGSRGSIETYQGSRLVVESVSGSVIAGVPPAGFTGRRGIVTLFREPFFGDRAPTPTGGGAIGIDVHDDFQIGGLALAALSGSDITIYTRKGSIDAGQNTPFTGESVFVDASGTVNVHYEGGGISAKGGVVGLFAKQDIKIGAGITGSIINIGAGGNLVGGTGSISGTTINASVGGTISGSLSASGSINISGGTVAQGTSLSAGGIVAGAGAGVGSNSGGGKVSSELSNLSQQANTAADAFQTAHAVASGDGQRSVMIQVTSHVIGEPGDDKDR